MSRRIDVNLGIKPQALAVLHLLADRLRDLHDPDVVEAAALYNGREQGVVVTASCLFSRVAPRCLNVFFSENRNSDDIVVYSWLGEGSMNPPTVSDITEDTWKSRKVFGYGQVGEAARYVHELIGDHLESRRKK